MNPEEIAPVAFDVTKRRLVKVTLDNMTRAMALLSSPNAKNDLLIERGIINNKKMTYTENLINPLVIEEDIPEEIRAEMDQSVALVKLDPVAEVVTVDTIEQPKKRGRKKKVDPELFNEDLIDSEEVKNDNIIDE